MARILLVEDDDNQRLLYREALEEAQHEVVEDRDGRAALTCIQSGNLDAVILDINMPGMDGLHTLTRIHNIDRRLPVILNSAYATYKEQYVSWIADAYVMKSSDPTELMAAVRDVLASRGAA